MGDVADRTLVSVLVVDDEVHLRRAAKAALGGRCVVRTASSVEAAEKSFATARPHMVICDLRLGGGWYFLPALGTHE